MVWLPKGVKRVRICLTVLTQYRCVTDRRTDGQTSRDSTVRAMHSIARQNVNMHYQLRPRQHDRQQQNYTVSQKMYPLMFDNNFGKCGPIFNILSSVDS